MIINLGNIFSDFLMFLKNIYSDVNWNLFGKKRSEDCYRFELNKKCHSLLSSFNNTEYKFFKKFLTNKIYSTSINSIKRIEKEKDQKNFIGLDLKTKTKNFGERFIFKYEHRSEIEPEYYKNPLVIEIYEPYYYEFLRILNEPRNSKNKSI